MNTTLKKADELRLSYITDFLVEYKDTIKNLQFTSGLSNSIKDSTNSIYDGNDRVYLRNKNLEGVKKIFTFYNIKVDPEVYSKLKRMSTIYTQLKNHHKLSHHVPVPGLCIGNDIYIRYNNTQIEAPFEVYINKKPWGSFHSLLKSKIILSEHKISKVISSGKTDKLSIELPDIDLSNQEVYYLVSIDKQTVSNCHTYLDSDLGATPPSWSLKERPPKDLKEQYKAWVEKSIQTTFVHSNIENSAGRVFIEYDPDDEDSFWKDWEKISNLYPERGLDKLRISTEKARGEVLNRLEIIIEHHLTKEDLPFSVTDFEMGILALMSLLQESSLDLTNTKFEKIEYLKWFLSDFNSVRNMSSSVSVKEGLLNDIYAIISYFEINSDRTPLPFKITKDKDIEDNSTKIKEALVNEKFNGNLPVDLNLGVLTTVIELWDVRWATYTHFTPYSRSFISSVKEYDVNYITWYEDSDIYNWTDASRVLILNSVRPSNYSSDMADNYMGHPVLSDSYTSNVINFHNKLPFDTNLSTPDPKSIHENEYRCKLSKVANLIHKGVHVMDLGAYVEQVSHHLDTLENNVKATMSIQRKIKEKAANQMRSLIEGTCPKFKINDIVYYPNCITYSGQSLKLEEASLNIDEGPQDVSLNTEELFRHFIKRLFPVFRSNTLGSGERILDSNFDYILDNFVQYLTVIQSFVKSEGVLAPAQYEKVNSKFHPYNSSYTLTFYAVIGEVKIKVSLVKKETKKNIQTYWYIEDNRMIKNEMKDILKTCLSFTLQEDVKDYINKIDKTPLKYQKLMDNGITFNLRDPIFNIIDSPVTLKFDREGSRNFIIHKGVKYKIKNSSKVLSLSRVKARDIKYPTHDIHGLIDIILNEEYLEGFPTSELRDLIVDGIKRYVNKISSSKQAIKNVENLFKLKYDDRWVFEDGTNRAGYKVEGNLASYIIEYNKGHSIEEINPRVFDYPTGKYRCMIDKAQNLSPISSLINRIYALSNDNSLSKEIYTLTD